MASHRKAYSEGVLAAGVQRVGQNLREGLRSPSEEISGEAGVEVHLLPDSVQDLSRPRPEYPHRKAQCSRRQTPEGRSPHPACPCDHGDQLIEVHLGRTRQVDCTIRPSVSRKLDGSEESVAEISETHRAAGGCGSRERNQRQSTESNKLGQVRALRSEDDRRTKYDGTLALLCTPAKHCSLRCPLGLGVGTPMFSESAV